MPQIVFIRIIISSISIFLVQIEFVPLCHKCSSDKISFQKYVNIRRQIYLQKPKTENGIRTHNQRERFSITQSNLNHRNTRSFSLSLSLIGPIYVLVFYGEYAIPTGHVMPFVEADTLRGYIINMIAQMFVGACALISVLTIEIAGCVINNTYKTMANIVCYNMRKFSDHLRHGTFSYANEVEFRNILVQLQDLEAYIRELNKLFYWKFFLQPILTTGCVSLAIFAQLMVDRLFFN